MAIYIYYIIDNDKLDSSNKISIHNCCHAPKMASDKEEAVQLMYLSKNIMNRPYNTVLLLRKFVINQRRNEVKYINDLQATSYMIFNTILKLAHSSIENKTITVLVVRSDH